MEKPTSAPGAAARRAVLKVQGQEPFWEPDEVATEWPLTLFVNGREFVTLVCTPTDLEDLIVGFLASEGVVRQAGDLLALELSVAEGIAQIRLADAEFAPELGRSAAGQEGLGAFGKRFITSCCGRGRISFYFANDAALIEPIEGGPRLDLTQCRGLVRAMEAAADLFDRTGGVHNACASLPDGTWLCRSDVGRHNALDKLYGHCLRAGGSVSGSVIVFSGRVSSEVLLKVAKLGAPIVLSKSAPTELALALAQEIGITVVGFIRGDHLNVYTHPERILL